MSFDVEALRRHAALSAEELLRASSRLRGLKIHDRLVVAGLLEGVGDGIVRLLLEEARRDPALAESLASIYGPAEPELARAAAAGVGRRAS
jgi:hypothetical protein